MIEGVGGSLVEVSGLIFEILVVKYVVNLKKNISINTIAVRGKV